jgi:hypothetical protein
MEKRRSSVEAEINALVTDLDDDDEVVFLQEWDQPTRRHKMSRSWRKDQTRRNWMIAAGVGAMMLVCTVGLMAVAVDSKGTVPEQLRGVWRTSTSRYADAALGLQAREIAFYNGRGIPDKYRIDDVRLAQVDDKIRYTVDYSGEEQAYTIQFLASRDVKPTLQLVSRPEMAWSRGNVRFGPDQKTKRATVARADTARALTPLSPEFVACIKAASRARAAGQEPVRCTQPTPEVGMGPALAAEVERDTTVSLMEELGAQRRNR